MDSAEFEQLDIGVSSHLRRMWWRRESDTLGTLRVEFHNRKGAECAGAVYDYPAIPQTLVDSILKVSEDPTGSVGAHFHISVIKAGLPYVKVKDAE